MFKRVLLLDLNYQLRRSVHVKAFAELRDAHGRKTGGVFGLLNTIKVCLERATPCQKVIGIWDGGLSARRLSLFPQVKSQKQGYKGHRGITEDMTEEEKAEKREIQETLTLQRELASPLLVNAGVHVLTWPEKEADDVLALLAREFENRQMAEQIIIASDDWDFAQCVTDRTVLYRAMKEEWISLHNFMEKLGVPVDWSVFKKSIEGDTSDNIDGVDGVGPKTISKALNEYMLDELRCDADAYVGHCYRNTFSTYFEPFLDWCENHRLKAYKKIGKGRDVIKRNIELMDLTREGFPPEGVEMLIGQVMESKSFNEMAVIQQMGELNISSLLENFSAWSDAFRRIS